MCSCGDSKGGGRRENAGEATAATAAALIAVGPKDDVR